MKQIIAIPLTSKVLSAHFGHCEEFYFATIEDEQIINERYITPPEHKPGLYPKWVHEQGAKLVIAGGMGPKAIQLFKEQKVEVIVGAEALAPSTLIQQFIHGTLTTSANSCNH